MYPISFNSNMRSMTVTSLIEWKAGVPVVCLSPQVATVYRPRQPRQSPLYQLIERYYPEFERSYDERYQQRYGTWRPIIGEVARRFLRCGTGRHVGAGRRRGEKQATLPGYPVGID